MYNIVGEIRIEINTTRIIIILIFIYIAQKAIQYFATKYIDYLLYRCLKNTAIPGAD